MSQSKSVTEDVQHGKLDDRASIRWDTDLDIAWELQGLPGCVIKDSILRRKHLLARGGAVKVMAALKHVLAVGVHVPVKEVCGCVHVHVAVGDKAHVGVTRPDGGEESNVVLHVPRLATVLRAQETVGLPQSLIPILSALLRVHGALHVFHTQLCMGNLPMHRIALVTRTKVTNHGHHVYHVQHVHRKESRLSRQ